MCHVSGFLFFYFLYSFYFRTPFTRVFNNDALSGIHRRRKGLTLVALQVIEVFFSNFINCNRLKTVCVKEFHDCVKALYCCIVDQRVTHRKG